MLREQGHAAVRRVGWQAGYRHESNGRDGAASRSYNVIYLRPIFSVGGPDRWHVTFLPEVWAYSGSHDRSPGIDRYRGDGLLRFLLGKSGGAWL